MSPWFTMQSGPESRRSAAASEATAAVSAIRCAVRLLEATAPRGRERELLAAIADELAQIRHAVRILAGR